MNTLDRVCRHLRQNPADILHPTCAAGVDTMGIRLIDRPCIRDPRRPVVVFCAERETMTEEDKAARMASFVTAMEKIGARLSPCCDAPFAICETERATWTMCSRCGGVVMHKCKAIGSEVPG